jgi:hypothetical protein
MINITPQQLRKAADIQEKILSLQEELGQLLGGETSTPASPEAPTTKGRKKRRKMSAEGRASIRAAQLARRARERGEVVTEAPAAKPKKKQVSEAKLRALAKAREARWAKVKGIAPKRKGRRKMSAAAKARLSVLAKARWKKAKAAGKTRL